MGHFKVSGNVSRSKSLDTSTNNTLTAVIDLERHVSSQAVKLFFTYEIYRIDRDANAITIYIPQQGYEIKGSS